MYFIKAKYYYQSQGRQIPRVSPFIVAIRGVTRKLISQMLVMGKWKIFMRNTIMFANALI